MAKLRRVAVVGVVSYLLLAAPLTAAISPESTSISAQAGSQFSGQVATFVSDDPQPFRIVVDWGDRTRSSAGTATCTNCPAPRGTYRVDASHTWARAGTYTAHVTIASSAGTATVDSTATVGDSAPPSGRAPVAALTVPAPVRLRRPVRLDASGSQGNGLTYRWDFDGSGAFATDGGSSPTLFHTFPKPGNQKVQVRVTNGAGSSVAAATVHVLGSAKRTMRFPARIAAGKTATFRFPVTNPKGVHTLYWQWSFGDGKPVPHTLGPFTVPIDQPTAKDTVSHRWTKPGHYTLQGSAVDDAGGVSTLALGIDVCAFVGSDTTKGVDAASANACAPKNGDFDPGKFAIHFDDGPVKGEPEYFTISGVAETPDHKEDAILQPCSHDVVTGEPINCLAGNGASTDSPQPVITWDFGDGGTDTGGPGDTTHVYASPGTYAVTLTLAYPTEGGVSKTAHATVHVMPPPLCGPVPVHGFTVRPEAGCLHAHPVGGVPLYETDNGVNLLVDGVRFSGTHVGVNPDTGALVGVKTNLTTYLGTQPVAVGPGYTLPASGKLDIPMKAGAVVGGATIAGGDLFLDPNGTATFAPLIALDAPFKGTAPVAPTPVAGTGTLAQIPDEYTLNQPNGMSYLGVGITNLSLTHHANNSWTGTGDLQLPGGLSISLGPGGPAGFPAQRGIGLNPLYVGARADFPAGAVPVAALFYLDHLGVQVSTAGTLRLSGDVGLTTMPAFNLFGIALAKVNGCVDLVDYQLAGPQNVPLCDGGVWHANDPEFLLHAHGSLNVLSMPFASAYFDYHSVGPVVAFGGSFDYEFAGGNFSIDGSLNAVLYSFSQWQVGPFGVHGCEHIIGDECLGVTALISSRGVVGCVDILGWDVGAWYRWSGAWGVVDSSCGVGHSGHVALGSYSLASLPGLQWPLDTVRRAQATVPLRRGLPFAEFTVKGAGAAPRIDVRGPGGVHLVDNGEDRQHTGPGKTAILRSKRLGTTFVFIDHPARGNWTVTAQPGSAAITDVSEADGLPKPALHAKVTGSGRARTLVYRVTPQPDQKVVFVEQAKGVARVLGAATGTSGRIHFVPADGRGGKRSIVALVTQGDLPRTSVAVASYAAPGPVVPAKPRGLRARVEGGKLVVTWRRSTGATSYRVEAKLGDGRRVTLMPAKGATTLTLSRYRSEGATIDVAGVSASGRVGKAARIVVKKHVRKPKPIVL